MTSIVHAVRALIGVRRDATRGVYVSCGAVALLAFVLAEDTSWRSMWPYYTLIALCAVQTWRPTLFLWGVLMAVFLLALATMIFAGTAATTDRLVLALLLGLPVIALWYFRPKSDGDRLRSRRT